mgnify:CR=1 FL=1
MKKIGKVMATLLALAGVVSFMSCASDGGGSGSAVTEYSGSFSVGGKDFSSLNIKSDGTYTMIGEDGNDSGTWTLTNDDSQRASAASEGTYEFTSSKLGGSFTVEVTQTSISLSAGTIEAKGSGVISNSSDAITAKLPASVGTNELTGKKFVREETKKRSSYTSYEKETLAFNSNGTAQVTDYYKYEPTEEAIAEGDRAEELNGFIDFNYSWNANDKLLYMAYVSMYAESTNKKISICRFWIVQKRNYSNLSRKKVLKKAGCLYSRHSYDFVKSAATLDFTTKITLNKLFHRVNLKNSKLCLRRLYQKVIEFSYSASLSRCLIS